MTFLPNLGEVCSDTLIKDNQSFVTTMITPKLTAVMMVAISALGAGPVAVFAQAANVQSVGDLTNAAAVETGGNSQVNAAETTQLADNSIEISQEVESEAEAESEAEGGDAESESGDAKGKYSESESEAEGGDATSGAEANSAALGLQNVEGNTFDNDVAQVSTTTQTNALDDSDLVTVTQANVPVQTQITPIAIDLLLEGLVL
jgi:hypothetical protein